MRVKRMVAGLAAVVTAVLGLSLATPGPASAGTDAAIRHTPLTPGKSMSFTTTLTRIAAAPGTADIITCGGTVTVPYLFDGGAGVRADVEASCDKPVDNIQVTAQLFRNGGLIAERLSPPAAGTHASIFAPANCIGVQQDYFGRGYALFVKAGYAGSPLYLGGQSYTYSHFC